jgi:uncharacterized protein
MTNFEIVRSFYGRLAKGDVSGVLSLFASEIAWTEAEGFPYYSGTWTRPQEIAGKLLVPVSRDWASFSVVAERFVIDGHRVISFGAYKATHKTTGKTVAAPFVHVWGIDDNKIKSFDMYSSTLLIHRATQA